MFYFHIVNSEMGLWGEFISSQALVDGGTQMGMGLS